MLELRMSSCQTRVSRLDASWRTMACAVLACPLPCTPRYALFSLLPAAAAIAYQIFVYKCTVNDIIDHQVPTQAEAVHDT